MNEINIEQGNSFYYASGRLSMKMMMEAIMSDKNYYFLTMLLIDQCLLYNDWE